MEIPEGSERRKEKKEKKKEKEKMENPERSESSTSSTPGRKDRRILSLDGGGVKGVNQLQILKELEKTQKLHESFDLIVGTSVGGLVAASIGLLGKTAEETSQLVGQWITDVFKKTSKTSPTSGLESLLKVNFEEKKMYEFCEGPKVAIVAVNNTQDNPHPYIFRNYEHPAMAPTVTFGHSEVDGSGNVRVWEALRASTAAPTFFDPIAIPIGDIKKTFIDGGLMYNNPVELAYQEAKRLWPDDEVSLIVSVGTGNATPKIGKQTFKGWYKSARNILTSSQEAHENFSRTLDAFKFKGMYKRFDPTGAGGIRLNCTKTKKLNHAKETTSQYLNSQEVSKRVSQVIEKLA